MTVTMEQIKQLRDATGIATMACKKALDEANGDIDKAIEILRKKGELKSAERADRETKEGVIAIATESGKAAMIKLACETDFVARNEDFIAAANKYANAALKNGESVDLSGDLNELNVKMGERVSLSEIKVVEAPVIGTYIHSNKKIGVVVCMDSGDMTVGNDVAMHVAASKPKVISPDEVDTTSVEKEKEIWAEQLKNEGKPANIIENIMKGKEKKFREENALLTQPFVKNPDQLVADYIGSSKVKSMTRFSL